MANNQTPMEMPPQTAMALLGMMLKKMPLQLLKSLPVSLLIGVLGFLINFWLMAYVNDGFNPGTWTSKNLIPVTGMMTSAVVLWGILGAMSTMIIRFLLRGGNPGTALTGFFRQPGVILSDINNGSNRFKAMLCFGVAATLLVGILFSGVTSIMTGLMLMASLGAFLTGRDSFLITFIQMAARDISKADASQATTERMKREAGVIIGASGLSLLIMGLIRAFLGFAVIQILLNAVWVIFLVIGLILFFSGKSVPGHMMLIFVFLGLGLTLHQLGITTVFADDGGRSEIGGSFWDYVNGQGAMEVIIRCFPPAIAAIFGSLFGAIFGSFAGTLGNIPGSINGPETIYTGTVDADLVYGSTDSLDGESVDDYDKRLQEYINSLNPNGASIMKDPLTGTEYRVIYDPVTDTYFELNSKSVFSMDRFKDAQQGAAGINDWRNHNAELDKDYHNKMNQLNDLKNQIQNDANQLSDPTARNNLYDQINAINQIQTDFLSGRGELTVPAYEPPPVQPPPPPVQPPVQPGAGDPPISNVQRGTEAIIGADLDDPFGDGVPQPEAPAPPQPEAPAPPQPEAPAPPQPEAPAPPQPEAPAPPQPEAPAPPQPEAPAPPQPEAPAPPQPEAPAPPQPEAPAPPQPEAPAPPQPEAPAATDEPMSDYESAGRGFTKFRDPDQNPFINDP